MGNRKKIVKSEFPSEYGQSKIPLIAWNLGFQPDFWAEVPLFKEFQANSLNSNGKIQSGH